MGLLIYYCVFFLFVYKCSCSSATTKINDCFVELDSGRLRGDIRRTLLNGTSFCSYKGIPYAKPPVGNLRFKDPDDSPEPWVGLRHANKEGKSCIQNDLMFGRDGLNDTSEDCLYLNVYTPHIRRHSRHNHHSLLPVMVWIHGGGYLFGNSDEYLYGPDFLLEHEIVLVTFNYRLGIFGFLNLGNDDVPGNAGLKDQVVALKWVKKYINLFGGNPDKVTIFGESAGAASVQYHLVSNMSHGLFHQAILQSGSVLSPWALNHDVENEAYQIGKLLGCKLNYDNDTKSLLICFREKPHEALRESQLHVTDPEDAKRGLFFTFLPSIEVAGTGKNNFLTSDPEKLIKRGHFKKVPCLVGFNNLEGFMFLKALNITGPDALSLAIRNFSWISIPASLGLKENSIEFHKVKNEVDRFYFNDLPVSWDLIKPYCDLLGDNTVVVPMHRIIEMMVKYSDEPIYAYEFAVDANRGVMKAGITMWNPLLNSLKGVSHFDEIGYLFNLQPYGEIPVIKGSTEDMTIKRLTALWTNFAKTGNPNGCGLNMNWEPYRVNQENCLRIDDSSMTLLKSSCEPKRINFWKNIYNTYKGV